MLKAKPPSQSTVVGSQVLREAITLIESKTRILEAHERTEKEKMGESLKERDQKLAAALNRLADATAAVSKLNNMITALQNEVEELKENMNIVRADNVVKDVENEQLREELKRVKRKMSGRRHGERGESRESEEDEDKHRDNGRSSGLGVKRKLNNNKGVTGGDADSDSEDIQFIGYGEEKTAEARKEARPQPQRFRRDPADNILRIDATARTNNVTVMLPPPSRQSRPPGNARRGMNSNVPRF